MANQEHVAILGQGVEAWNRWRTEHPTITPDLSGVQLIGHLPRLLGGIDEPNLAEGDLRGVNFRKVELDSARFDGVDLSEADLREAHFSLCSFNGVNLTGADLSHGYGQQVDFGWQPNLSNVNCTRTGLVLAQLSGANLKGAQLIQTDLRESVLTIADLTGANLHSALLSRNDLTGANLAGANLTKAHLDLARFVETNVDEADFRAATLSMTLFDAVDLRKAHNLDTVRHGMRSAITIDTIYKSAGEIPLPFLRGAGVPENFITYMSSLTGAAFEFYSCFISYSGEDQAFADLLYESLQARGVRCWFAPHDIRGGEKTHDQIDKAIKLYDKLLLILSDASMSSEWVKTEIYNARQRELLEKRQMIFPISLVSFEQIKAWKAFDADTGKDSAREIREYFIPDFSNWRNHLSYTEAFERLIRDLKAGAALESTD